MEAGLDFNILGVDWRQMEGSPQTQVRQLKKFTEMYIDWWGMGGGFNKPVIEMEAEGDFV